MTQTTIVRRSSFLKRNPALMPAAFSAHYETSHGPLAASLPGFRKHTLRYVQNHVEHTDGVEPLFDGITMTTQVPREDYSRGFFSEPDYEKVKGDEFYLFDMSRTVSVLADVLHGPVAPRAGSKAVFLAGSGWQAPDCFALDGALDYSLARIDPASASALGFHGAAFNHPYIIEAWFETPAIRNEAVARADRFGAGAAAMPVREVLIFGPEKPWAPEADG
ncbi:EthD domain-containing protein [Mesorhizobium sp. ASY16-5R]|uniref:EthD domain-containing protein n=1 Tax=Mesorhizobium sp. ASY16-5R TaxID=3445772 RepID=UPI003F9F65DF